MTISRRVIIGMMIFALLLIAYTFQRPTAAIGGETFRYTYVFDISQSMNVTDVSSQDEELSRLEFAKQAAISSLTSLPCGSEVGVALFSGHRAFLLITPIEICANYSELSTILSRIDWRMTWERSSEVAKGLHKSLTLLSLLEQESRLVFFTDGQESPPIRIDLPPSFTGTPGEVTGMIVGVGGDEPVAIPKFDETGKRIGVWQKDEVVQGYTSGTTNPFQGIEHLSALREGYLKEVANGTGLDYYRLEQIDGFTRRLESTAYGFKRIAVTDIRWIIALVALALILLAVTTKPRLAK